MSTPAQFFFWFSLAQLVCPPQKSSSAPQRPFMKKMIRKTSRRLRAKVAANQKKTKTPMVKHSISKSGKKQVSGTETSD